MPGGIFLGRWGFAQGGLWGMPRRPRKMEWPRLRTLLSLALNRVWKFKTFMLILPVFLPVAHRSYGIYDCFLCLYKIACAGMLILWGLPRTSRPKQERRILLVLLLEAPA